jgi:hypothetical protein
MFDFINVYGNNVYLAGQSANKLEIVLQKHDLNGNMLWNITRESQSIEGARHISLYGGMLYVTGIEGSVIIDNGRMRGVADLLVVKYMGGFATKPIRIFGVLGALLLAMSMAVVGLLVYLKLGYGEYFIRSPLLHLSALLFTVGVQFIMLGLLAEMNVRIYYESQRKPIYSIKSTLNAHPKVEKRG